MFLFSVAFCAYTYSRPCSTNLLLAIAFFGGFYGLDMARFFFRLNDHSLVVLTINFSLLYYSTFLCFPFFVCKFTIVLLFWDFPNVFWFLFLNTSLFRSISGHFAKKQSPPESPLARSTTAKRRESYYHFYVLFNIIKFFAISIFACPTTRAQRHKKSSKI